jgi:Holliday junction resolvase
MGVTKYKGSLAEAKVLTYLVQQGFNVSLPWNENSRYDLIAEKNGRFLRVQIKYVTPKDGKLSIPLRSANNWNVIRYKKEDVDFIAAYNPNNDKVYFLPLQLFKNIATVNLRLNHPNNNQKRKILYAKQFENRIN